MEDSLLNEFVNESREHLATIEADLLAIEEAGANLDEQLVNKVFRAAHSIKGGSGFFGLNKVKDLAHKAETVLDMLRSGKMVPNAEITNVLLAAFDKLRDLINHTETQEQADIADLLVSLAGLASSYLPPDEKASLTAKVDLRASGDAKTTVSLPQVDFERAKREGQHVYCLELDLIHDIERKGRSVLTVFRDIWESGEILDCAMDYEAVGTLDGPLGNQLPLRLVFATVIQPADITLVVDVDRERFKVLFDPSQTPPPKLAPPPEPAVVSAPMPRSDEVALRTPAGPPATLPPETIPTGTATKMVPPPATASAAAESTLRVHVGLLETLMNLAGEMILSRNQLRDAIARNDPRALSVAD